MQFWATRDDAERYSKSRPYFHDLVIDKIRSVMGLTGHVGWALDVGCGSGQSSTALAGLSTNVVAIDPSGPMLRSATGLRAERLQAVAESLPFVDHWCDLITVALAFHWLDRDRFLPEAARVLRTSGWLVIYNNYFLGQMRENTLFRDWMNEEYLKRYPVPPRHAQPLTDDVAAASHLTVVERQTYANEIIFDAEELCSYLMTSTNVIAAVRSGAASEQEVHRWLMQAVIPLFPSPRCTFVFGGFVWYLRPQVL